MREIPNTWRIFAINDEAGSIICDYPKGKAMPDIPLAYAQECMTGFEYAFAGLLISEGFLEEGLQVIQAVRDRYDGEKRNPWNEIECGSNYARSMASFALLPIFSGFTFDVPKKHIGFSPIISGNFRCMWNLGTGWGDFIKKESKYKIIIADGVLELKSICLGNLSKVKHVCIDGKKVPFTQDGSLLSFAVTKAEKEICIEV